MKKLMSILTLVLVLCLGLTGCAADKKDAGEKKAQAAEIGVTVGKIAPAFQLKDLDGKEVSINVAKDKKTLSAATASLSPYFLIKAVRSVANSKSMPSLPRWSSTNRA